MITKNQPNLEKRFVFSLLLTCLILFAEIVGGIWSGSLALLSDAAHVFLDVFALFLSYLALRFSIKPPDDRHTYGWYRLEIVAALINGTSLVMISIGIWIEAIKRWQNPIEIRSSEMLIIAIIGLIGNIIVAIILGKHEHDHQQKTRNLNIQSAFLHVVGDAVSSVGVIIAAILIHYTGIQWIDPLVSMLIGLIIFASAYRILRSSLHILLEGVPENLSLRQISQRINQIEFVQTIHDLHVWNLGSEQVSLSAHVILQEGYLAKSFLVLEEIRRVLENEFHIQHTTIQFESTRCSDGRGDCN
ncbi:MAG: cation diffusion facilitator family transporter [Chloroflexi bacterium]|nr:cation diffusion facilitator family transporter [Chloroflexota bacterium]